MAFLRLSPSDRIGVIALAVSVFTVFFSVYQYRQQTTESLDRERVDSIRFNQQISDQRIQFEAQMHRAEEHFIKQFELTKKSDSAQLKLTEQSIKNFVRPVLVIRRYSDPESEELGLFVQNSGIGPAIITSVELYYDKRLLKNASEITAQVIKDSLAFWDPPIPPSFSDFQRYDVIQKGEAYKVYYISGSSVPAGAYDYGIYRSRLKTILKQKLKIIVHYRSLTEDNFIVSD